MAEIAKAETPVPLSAESVRIRADAAAKIVQGARGITSHPYFDPDAAERALSDFDASADDIRSALQDFRTRIAAPASEQDIGRAVATIVGVFGTPAGSNAKVYTGILIERVARQRPSIAALDQAVTQLIDTCRFPPAVAEVLDALSARQKPISARLDLLSQAEAERDRLARRIDRRRSEIQHLGTGEIDR